MPAVCLTRSRNADGDLVVRLGVSLLDEYLEFLAGRCRPNTVLAVAYDLKVFLTWPASRRGASAQLRPHWRQARARALSPGQAASPLVTRPYDLRHSGVMLSLNAGVPAPEVARRAGHGVAVLLRVYAGCIDGQDQL